MKKNKGIIFICLALLVICVLVCICILSFMTNKKEGETNKIETTNLNIYDTLNLYFKKVKNEASEDYTFKCDNELEDMDSCLNGTLTFADEVSLKIKQTDEIYYNDNLILFVEYNDTVAWLTIFDKNGQNIKKSSFKNYICSIEGNTCEFFQIKLHDSKLYFITQKSDNKLYLSYININNPSIINDETEIKGYN